ncbi:MAG: hypothetical protein ACR2LC_11770 [Pyrinomonadaceae bacterium]
MNRTLKITLFVGLLVVLILSPAARNLTDSKFRSSTEINGVVLRTLKVDSEYGTFNFRITHDIYIQDPPDTIPHSEYRIAVTNGTRFFAQNGNNLQPISLQSLKAGDEIRARVVGISDSTKYTMVTAVEIVVNNHSNKWTL